MDTEIRAIQLKCLEILKIVDSICRRHGIEYSLCGGSVVGAHLYGKCLPWDDDIDLMMTRKNYDFFNKVAFRELPAGYSIHNFESGNDFTTPFTKIMKDTTTIVQQDGTVSGVFLDITVYDRIPSGRLAIVDHTLWKLSQIVMIGKIDAHRPIQYIRNILLSTILRRRSYLQFFRYMVKMLGKSKRYTYSELFGAFANTVSYEPHIFENYTEIHFEDGDYMIVRDYIDYLTSRYNRTDFREPKERQVAPHYQYVNFQLPYKDYIHTRQ